MILKVDFKQRKLITTECKFSEEKYRMATQMLDSIDGALSNMNLATEQDADIIIQMFYYLQDKGKLNGN